MKAKHSKKDDKGRVYVDCSECDRGGNGMDVHFSSKTDMWSTPQDTFDALPYLLAKSTLPEKEKRKTALRILHKSQGERAT